MYKGFDPDLRCSGFQYEIGKTYEIDDKPILCLHGFHACKTLFDVFRYYPPISQTLERNRFCEVECDGDYTIGYDKSVFQRIKIVKELDFRKIARMCNLYASPIAINTMTNYLVCANNDAYNISVNTGYWSYVSTDSNANIATTTGQYSISEANGINSISCNTALHAKSIVNGKDSIAVTIAGHAVANHEDSIAIASCGGAAKGVLGSILVFIEGKIVKSVQVDGNTILPDTLYVLKDGEITKL